MPWPAIPFKDKRIKSAAKEFSVKGLPQLIVLNAATGETIHNNGVDIVTQLGPVIIERWIKLHC